MNVVHEIIELGQSVPSAAEMDLNLVQKILHLNAAVRISDIRKVGATTKNLHCYYVEAAQLLNQYLSVSGQAKLSDANTLQEVVLKQELARLADELIPNRLQR